MLDKQHIAWLNSQLPPGRNFWFSNRAAAAHAAHRAVQHFGGDYRVHHHIYSSLKLPHFHIKAPNGRFLRLRFFYKGSSLTESDQFDISKKQAKHNLGLRAAYRFAAQLRRYRFLPTIHFVERFLQRASSQGMMMNPKDFIRAFARAQHYIQTRPGYNTRIALVRGIPVIYRMTGTKGMPKTVKLIGVYPADTLPPVRKVAAPLYEGAWNELE